MDGIFLILLLVAVIFVCLILGLAYIGACVLVHMIRRLLDPHSGPRDNTAARLRATGRAARTEMDTISNEFIRQAYDTLRRN